MPIDVLGISIISSNVYFIFFSKTLKIYVFKNKVQINFKWHFKFI